MKKDEVDVNGEGWHYIAVIKQSALYRGITAKKMLILIA